MNNLNSILLEGTVSGKPGMPGKGKRNAALLFCPACDGRPDGLIQRKLVCG
jgi:hypothetical protein